MRMITIQELFTFAHTTSPINPHIAHISNNSESSTVPVADARKQSTHTHNNFQSIAINPHIKWNSIQPQSIHIFHISLSILGRPHYQWPLPLAPTVSTLNTLFIYIFSHKLPVYILAIQALLDLHPMGCTTMSKLIFPCTSKTTITTKHITSIHNVHHKIK